MIQKTALISRFASVRASRLEMDSKYCIGPFTMCKGLELLLQYEYGFIEQYSLLQELRDER
jgi:hypothetical protein